MIQFNTKKTIFKIKHTGIFLFLILPYASLLSQTSFETLTQRDTLCLDDFVEFINIQPSTAQKYAWDFCAPDLNENPKSGDITVLPEAKINGPAFMSTIEANGGIYTFITNYNDGTLTRLFFTDIKSSPTAINLGSLGGLLPIFPEGIKIEKDGDNYVGFIVGGQKPNFRIARLDFGTNLSDTPRVVLLTDINEYLDYPKGICLKKSDTWLAFITNFGSNNIIKLTFNNGLSNTPTIEKLPNINLNGPIGIQIINDESGKWFAFVSNSGGNTSTDYSITRIIFNNKFEIESADKIYNSLLNRPFDITFFENCEKKYGYVLNSFTNAVQMTFPSSLAENPEFKSIPMGALSNPHGISELFRLKNSINVLVSHTSKTSNSISRIYYESPCDASYQLWSDKHIPAAFHYPDTGKYNISLQAENALGLKSFYCRPVYVAPNPHFDMGSELSVCPNVKPLLPTPPDSIGFIFSDSIIADSHNSITRTYTVWRQYENKYQCKFNDSIKILEYLPTLNIGSDKDEVYGTPVIFDAGTKYISYHWNTGETNLQITASKSGIYSVSVKTEQNCNESDTVVLKYHLEVPNYITPNASANTHWYVPVLQNFPKADVRIYDRTGNLVAAYKGGSDQGWDGTCNGRPLAADAYWYFIDLHNGDKVFTGNVSIIR